MVQNGYRMQRLNMLHQKFLDASKIASDFYHIACWSDSIELLPFECKSVFFDVRNDPEKLKTNKRWHHIVTSSPWSSCCHVLSSAYQEFSFAGKKWIGRFGMICPSSDTYDTLEHEPLFGHLCAEVFLDSQLASLARNPRDAVSAWIELLYRALSPEPFILKKDEQISVSIVSPGCNVFAASARTLELLDAEILSRTADPNGEGSADEPSDVPPGGDTPKWPPNEGWGFQPGKAAYNGTEIPITGKQWQLLKALVEAKRPLTRDNLRAKAWAEDEASDVDDHTVGTHLSNVRRVLRCSLSLPKDCDPIPRADRGTLIAWELHPELRQDSVKKI